MLRPPPKCLFPVKVNLQKASTKLNMLNGHGGNINNICNTYGLNPDEIMDFSASINPLGYPDTVRKIILERFDDILNYPDSECGDLQKVIAERHSCKESNIIIGNGSNELFHLIPRALKPKQGVVLQPTFSEFKNALYNANVEVIEIINNSESLKFDLDDSRLKDFKEGIVFLCNPNNPTGQLITKEAILGVAKDYPERLMVVDEAFMDFVEEEERFSVIKEATTMKNLIVVRSLTKFYGFPGLRLGYLVAQVAGQVALNDKEFTFNTKRFMSGEKIFLYEGLSEIKELHPFHPSVNFVLVRIGNGKATSSSLHDLLIKDKIIIRDCSNFIGLSDKYFRVAVRTRDENQKLLSALKVIMNHQTAEVVSKKDFSVSLRL